MNMKEFNKYVNGIPVLLKSDSIEFFMGIFKADYKNIALDLCCGAGNASFIFSPHFKNIISIDTEPQMIKKANNKKSEKGIKNVFFEIGDAQSLKYPNELFDAVIARGAFRHVHDYKKAINECYRVLKPEGKLYLLEVVLPDGLIDLWEEIGKFRTDAKKHYWTYNTLLKIFRDNFFDPLIVVPSMHEYTLEKWLDEINDNNARNNCFKKIMDLSQVLKEKIYFSEIRSTFKYELVEIVFQKKARYENSVN